MTETGVHWCPTGCGKSVIFKRRAGRYYCNRCEQSFTRYKMLSLGLIKDWRLKKERSKELSKRRDEQIRKLRGIRT